MILTCYNFEFFKQEDLCLFTLSDKHYLCPSRNRFFRAFCTKNLTSDGNNSNDFSDNQLTKFRAV